MVAILSAKKSFPQNVCGSFPTSLPNAPSRAAVQDAVTGGREIPQSEASSLGYEGEFSMPTVLSKILLCNIQVRVVVAYFTNFEPLKNTTATT